MTPRARAAALRHITFEPTLERYGYSATVMWTILKVLYKGHWLLSIQRENATGPYFVYSHDSRFALRWHTTDIEQRLTFEEARDVAKEAVLKIHSAINVLRVRSSSSNSP